MNENDLFVCVIGSSAGGINALKKFFTSFSSFPENIAFIVAQHLNPGTESHLAPILSSGLSIPVVTATTYDVIRAGRIYVAPPDKNITVLKGRIILKPANTIYKPSIDNLFISASGEYGKKLIGIILTGTGKDGAKGVVAINKMGGYTVVQQPGDAEYDTMPLAAIRTNSVDAIAECRQIPAIILDYTNNKNLQKPAGAKDGNETPVKEIFNVLLRNFGTDFNGYKTATIERRIDLRMGQVHCASPLAYLAYIEKNPQETGILYKHLLIGVTEFFRDKEAFGVLHKKLAELIDGKPAAKSFRVWSAACSTGEEAYTLAIILLEILGENIHKHNVKVYASDIDETALAIARKGIYTAEQVKTMPSGMLEKYFTKTTEGWVVNNPVRALVVFHKHDITSEPPFVQVELICCRNLLIYFNGPLQNRIFAFFHYALKDGGMLFLGKSETINRHKDVFTTLSAKYRLYKKTATANNQYPYLLKNARLKPFAQAAAMNEAALTDMLKDRFYEGYQHAFVVVNEKNDIQHIHGDISRFIRLPQGSITFNLVKVAHKELQIELRALLYKCLGEGKDVYGRAKNIKLEKDEICMRIAVWPLRNTVSQAKFFAVAFEVFELAEFSHLFGTGTQTTRKNSRIVELEKELQQSKEHLQAFIDQLETANAQLQLLNEEQHNTNEELQVANQELEAHNEEQQEANEQLADAFEKLKQMHNLLEQNENVLRLTNNKFQTVLDNAKECYILAGYNYMLDTFNHEADTFFTKLNNTPLVAGESMFHFLPVDFIAGFKQRFDKAWGGEICSYEIKHVIANETVWLNARYAPVYGHGNKIENVLLSFIDITEQVNAQQRVDASELLFRSMTENSADIIIRQDADGKIIYVSSSVVTITGYTQHQMLNRTLHEFLPEDCIASANLANKAILGKPALPVILEFCLKHKNGSLLWIEGTAVNMLAVPGVASVIINMRDVTFRKLVEQKIYASELKFRSLIENSHDGIALLDAESKLTYLSNAVTRIMGYTPDELLGVDPASLTHHDDVDPLIHTILKLVLGYQDTETTEYRMKHKNGEWRWLKSNITNMLHEQHIGAIVMNYEDITERKSSEEFIKQSERMMADAQRIAHFGSWEMDIADEKFDKIRWSEEVFRIFGFAPSGSEVPPEKFFASVHPEDRAMVEETAAKAYTENTSFTIDHRIIWPDGSIRWVHEDAEFIKDARTGKLFKLTGMVKDITDRKNAEDRLLKSEANLKAIFDNTEIAYTMLDDNLNIVTFNPKASKLINEVYRQPLHAGNSFFYYLKDDSEAGRLRAVIKRIEEGRNIKFDYHSLLPSGDDMWNLVRINPILDANGQAHGMCIAVSDITHRKKHEIETQKITNDLIQRNKDLEQFTYVVSHNLRAPLTNIIGLSQLLLEDNQTEDFKNTYTKQLYISAQKMDVIIKDLNHVLQIKKEVSEVNQTVYFSELVEDIMLSMEYIMLQVNVEIITDFTALNELRTIKSYLYSIFYNLIINSIKYRRPGITPVIEIKSRLSAKKLELIFRDNGLGIDLNKKGKEVFGLFKRFHYHVEGKGMGLFMVKTQVVRLGGAISVESEINKGTRFTISFPLG